MTLESPIGSAIDFLSPSSPSFLILYSLCGSLKSLLQSSSEQREYFFRVGEEEIVKINLAGKSILIETDFNSQLWREFIPNDPHGQDKNGQLLSEIIRRHHVTVANGLVVCEGTITRKCVTTQRTEESAMSFVLVSEDLTDKVESVIKNEKRDHVLTSISKLKHEKALRLKKATIMLQKQ